MNWQDRKHFPPLLGLFNLSPLERVVHSVLIFLFGTFLTSYKNMDIYQAVIDNKPHDNISSWYILPFVFLSFWIFKPFVQLKIIENWKTTSVWRYLLFGSMWDILFLIILHFLYLIVTFLFQVNIWS